MEDRDVNRLVKLLELSTSDVDAEALAAVRMSRKLLQKYGMSYEMLIAEVRQNSAQNALVEINDLKNVVHSQSLELQQLKHNARNVQPHLKEETIFTSANNFHGSIYNLKKFLLLNFELRHHEREILEGITTISPKSKEEFLVLICARRHKVTHELN